MVGSDAPPISFTPEVLLCRHCSTVHGPLGFSALDNLLRWEVVMFAKDSARHLNRATPSAWTAENGLQSWAIEAFR